MYPNGKLFPIYKWQLNAISSFAITEEILSKGAEQLGGKKVEKKVDTRKKKTKKKRAIIHFRAIDFCLRTTVGGSRTVHKKTEAPSCDEQEY